MQRTLSQVKPCYCHSYPSYSLHVFGTAPASGTAHLSVPCQRRGFSLLETSVGTLSEQGGISLQF